MSNVYLHDPAEVDFSTTGYGALPLSECTFTEEKNGRSMLSGTVVMTEDDAVWGKLELGSVIDAKVPMRENPVKGRIPTGTGKTITMYTVQATVSGKKLNLHVEPNQNSRVIKAYPAGTRVIGMSTSGSYTNVVICDGGATGWMWSSYLGNATVIPVDTPGAIDSIITPTKEREQLFRVVTLRKTIGSIYFEADHIFYDLSKHITHYKSNVEVTASVACAGVLTDVVNKIAHPHEFTISTDSNATQPKLDYQGQSVVKALLDPAEGIAEKYGLEIVRDNFDIGMLTAAGTNRGGVIEHGVNAVSLTVTRNTSNLYTRIIPYGKKADGGKLYLHDTDFNQITVTSTTADASIMRLGGYMLLDCTEEAAVSKDMTVLQARVKMRELANEQFTKYHVDEPEYEIKAQHVNLGDTEEYPEYAGLDRLYLYDIVNVRYKAIDLNVNAEVTRITYNCLTNRVESLELSDVIKAGRVRTIPTWEVPTGLTGDRFEMGTITFDRLSGDVGDGIDLSGNPTIQEQGQTIGQQGLTIQEQAQAISQVSSDVDELSRAVEEVISRTNGLSTTLTSTFTQTTNEIRAALTRITEIAADGTETADGLAELKTLVETYFSFTEDGLKIGKTGNPFTFRVDERQLGFYVNDILVAYMANDQLYIDKARILRALRIGDYGFEQDDIGDLYFNWYGEE